MQRSICRTLALLFCVSWSGGMWESWSQDEDKFDTYARSALQDWKLLSLQELGKCFTSLPLPLAAKNQMLDISVFAWTKGGMCPPQRQRECSPGRSSAGSCRQTCSAAASGSLPYRKMLGGKAQGADFSFCNA